MERCPAPRACPTRAVPIASVLSARRTVHRLPAEPCSYRGDVSGGTVTVTPNSAATYAANSSLVGRHPS